MIFKFDGRFIAVWQPCSAQQPPLPRRIAAPPNSEQPVRPTHSGSAAATFPIPPGSSTACGRTNPVLAMRVDRFSSKAPAQWLAEANN